MSILKLLRTFLLTFGLTSVSLGARDSEAASSPEPTSVSTSCTANGISLYGRVQVVESFGDVTVRVVGSMPDLKVKAVSSFADQCGEWQFVSNLPDFKIQYVDNFADIDIMMTRSFPGIPN